MMKIWLALVLSLVMAGCASTAAVTKASTTGKPATTKEKTQVKKQPAPIIKKPFVVQLKFPVPGGRLSSPFNMRGKDFHRGLDIAAPLGTPVLACMDGKVTYVGRYKLLDGYGNAIMVSHGHQTYTFYAHLYKAAVKRGDKVQQGQQIGYVGNTGKSKGPHLHLELIIKERHHNPAEYLEANFSLSSKITEWFLKFKKTVPMKGVFRHILGDD